MMKKILVILTALFLSACVSPPQLNAPETVEHNKKTYHLATKQDLESVVRYFYVLPNESAQHWQSAVEILLDRNKQKRTLQERIDWRKRIYTNTGIKNFHLYAQDNTLYAYVIYEPSVENKDWQIDVAKGKELPFCGFVQYQYSLKIPKTQKLVKMGKVKLIGYLKKYAVDKELERLIKAEWTLKCKPAPLDTPQSNEQ